MDSNVQRAAIEAARALEKRGDANGANEMFRRIGAYDEVARILAGQRKFAEAGHALFDSLATPAARVGTLDSAKKKFALMAAIYLAKSAETALAIEIFLGLGEKGRAAELMAKSGDSVGAARVAGVQRPTASAGDISLEAAKRLEAAFKHELALAMYVQLRAFADAARIAKQLGRTADAAQLFADASMPFESASAWLEAGHIDRSLASFVRIPRGDPRYRFAAVQVVRVVAQRGTLDFATEGFLSQFLATGPADDRECEAFHALGQVCERTGLFDNAKEIYRRLALAKPGYRDVAERMRNVEQRTAGPLISESSAWEATEFARSTRAPQAAIDEEGSELPGLPELPALDLPALAVSPAGPAAPEPKSAPAKTPSGARTTPFTIGATIAERYRLEQRIGQGGMAVVFRATDLELNEEVALKVFTMSDEDPEMVMRFKQELKLSRQLAHPNIIRLYDIGIFEAHRYISMELLTGASLTSQMGTAPMEFSRGLAYLIQACAGLGAVHDAGVVHRDVKPDNMFVTKEGMLKVMDFGIAKQTAGPARTLAGQMAGTPQYMSPEQINNFGKAGPSTDLYALGVIAYQMFTGTIPFHHAEVMPLLMMQMNQAPQPPRERNPRIPEELERVILKLLAKDPAARHASCKLLAQELLALRQRLSAR